MRRVTKHLIFSLPGGGLTTLDVSFDSEDRLAAVIAQGALVELERLVLTEACRQGCVLQHSHVSRQNFDHGH